MEKPFLNFEKILELTKKMIISLNKNGEIVLLNKKGYEILGYEKDELIGKNWFDTCLPKNNVRVVKGIFNKLMMGDINSVEHYENLILRKDDEKRLIHWHNTIIKDDDENIAGLLSSGEDITERKKIEEEIKYQANLLQNISDAIISTDSQFNIKSWNQAAEKMYGWKKDQVIGKNVGDVCSITYPNNNPDEIIDEFLKNRFWSGISNHKTKDGKDLIVQANVRLIKSDTGEIDAVSVNRDITKQRNAEKELKNSEKKYRELVDNLSEGIWVMNNRGITTFINNQLAEILGFTPEEIVGKTIFKFMDENGVNFSKEKIRNRKKGSLKKYDFEFDFIRKNGERIHTRMKTSPIINEKNQYVGTLASVEDITSRKKIEEELRSSEQIFSTILETAPSLMLITDKKGNVSYISPNSKEFTGYTPEEFKGNFNWWIHPEDTINGKKLFDKTFSEGISGRNFEYKAIKKNGEVWYASSSWEPIKDIEGNFNGIVMQTIDITDKKIKEQELKKNLLRYNTKEGYLYLEFEKIHIKSLTAFKELVNIGYNGIIISRALKKQFKDEIKNNTLYFWLADKKQKEGINVKDILSELEKRDNYVIYFERMDYVLSKIGFNKTLELIQKLTELAYIKSNIIIISIDPDILNKQQMTKIQKETNELEPKLDISIDEDLKEILEYIYSKNINGLKPNYSEIGGKLNISKPTTRNKIRRLIQSGYIIENIKGRKKILEITEMTRRIFA